MRFCEIREYDTDGKAVRGQLFYDQVTMLVQLGHMRTARGLTEHPARHRTVDGPNPFTR
jgi:hypothetical protein